MTKDIVSRFPVEIQIKILCNFDTNDKLSEIVSTFPGLRQLSCVITDEVQCEDPYFPHPELHRIKIDEISLAHGYHIWLIDIHDLLNLNGSGLAQKVLQSQGQVRSVVAITNDITTPAWELNRDEKQLLKEDQFLKITELVREFHDIDVFFILKGFDDLRFGVYGEDMPPVCMNRIKIKDTKTMGIDFGYLALNDRVSDSIDMQLDNVSYLKVDPIEEGVIKRLAKGVTTHFEVYMDPDEYEPDEFMDLRALHMDGITFSGNLKYLTMCNLRAFCRVNLPNLEELSLSFLPYTHFSSADYVAELVPGTCMFSHVKLPKLQRLEIGRFFDDIRSERLHINKNLQSMTLKIIPFAKLYVTGISTNSVSEAPFRYAFRNPESPTLFTNVNFQNALSNVETLIQELDCRSPSWCTLFSKSKKFSNLKALGLITNDRHCLPSDLQGISFSVLEQLTIDVQEVDRSFPPFEPAEDYSAKRFGIISEKIDPSEVMIDTIDAPQLKILKVESNATYPKPAIVLTPYAQVEELILKDVSILNCGVGEMKNLKRVELTGCSNDDHNPHFVVPFESKRLEHCLISCKTADNHMEQLIPLVLEGEAWKYQTGFIKTPGYKIVSL